MGPKTLSNATHINLHLSVESIVEKQVVGHPYSVWFHRVSLAIVVVADVTYCSQDTNQAHFKLLPELEFKASKSHKNSQKRSLRTNLPVCGDLEVR